VQEIYRLQGVRINDKHIEVIVRQMLRRVRIKEVATPISCWETQVEKWAGGSRKKIAACSKTAVRLRSPRRCCSASPRRGLSTESFISAASFQGDHQGAHGRLRCSGKVDRWSGLKENVIMGPLIPAGTGVQALQPAHSGDRRLRGTRRARVGGRDHGGVV
jgi:DNA-directed RNA polymerase subunit beta'